MGAVFINCSDNTPYEKIGDAEPLSIADEVPFDIPDSWEWCRLSSVVSVLNGDRGKNYPAKSTLSASGIPFISALNLDGKTVVEDDNLLCLSEAQYEKLGNGKLIKGDIVVCIRGSLGKHGRFPFEKGAIASSLVILRPFCGFTLLSDYIMMYLDTPLFFAEIKRHDNGTAQPNLAANSLEQFFVPIPPINEQRRILQILSSIDPFVSKYNETFSALDKLNDSFPELLKKSVLQMAVQGKLVPQDTNDEPAGILLKRIHAEKEHLIAEGRIKRDKNESVIYRRDNSHYEKRGELELCIDDDLPFTIPENWQWCHISDMCFFQEGPGILAKDFRLNGVPLIRIAGMQEKKVQLTGCNFLDPAMVDSKWKHFRLDLGDIVISTSASLDKIAEVGIEAVGAVPYTGLIRFKMFGGILKEYFTAFIKSPCYINQIAEQEAGSAIKHYGPTHLKMMVISIPPINEQQRIVDEINRVMPFIDAL